MVHSLELVLDDEADASVIAEVNRLAAAGLRNPHRCQRPHITLVAADTIGEAALGALAPVAQRLPTTVRLGAPIVFSRGAAGAHGGHVLARTVVPSADLLGVHATVLRLAADHIDGEFAHSRPGSWSPHVTLARRLSTEQVAAAIDLLADGDNRDIVVAGIRRWDGETKTETVLPGRAC